MSYVPDLRRTLGSMSDVKKYRDYNTLQPGWGGVGWSGGIPYLSDRVLVANL